MVGSLFLCFFAEALSLFDRLMACLVIGGLLVAAGFVGFLGFWCFCFIFCVLSVW